MTREEALRLILVKADEIEQILRRWNPVHGADDFHLKIGKDWYTESGTFIVFAARPKDRNIPPIYYSELRDQAEEINTILMDSEFTNI